MGKTGKFSVAGLKRLQSQLNRIQASDMDAFVESLARELATRLLAKAIRRTPVGDYSKEIEVTAKRDSKYHKKGDVYKKRVNPSGKMGGTLRRGWISQTHEEASGGKGTVTAEKAREYADSMEIRREGNNLVIEIANPVYYAGYVEYGHRTPNHKGWVKGVFMLTISEQELQEIAPKVLEARIKQYLEGIMK